MIRVTSLLITALFAIGASAVAAQHRPAREGFNLALGYGSATYDLTCTGCTPPSGEDPWSGGTVLAAHVKLAHATERLVGGIEVSLRGGSEPGKRGSSIFAIMLVGQYYPSSANNLHIIGGIGVASISLQEIGGGAETSGLFARAGAGYDFSIGKSFALTPYAHLGHVFSSQDRITTSGSFGTVTALENRTVLEIGVALNRY